MKPLRKHTKGWTMAAWIYLKLIRKILFCMLLCAGSARASSEPSDPPGQLVPLAQKILDQAPPDDAFELYVLAIQLDQIGLHKTAARIQTYDALLALEKALGQPAPKTRTLLAVAADNSIEKAFARQARHMAFKDIAIAFYPAVLGRDTIASMSEMDRTSLQNLVELAPGLWGVFGEKGNENTSSQKVNRFFLIATVRPPPSVKANLRFVYELSGGAPMSCTINHLLTHGSGYALCDVILTGTRLTDEGRRVAALTSDQKTSIFEKLRALQQGGPAPLPGAVYMELPDFHLEIKVEKHVQIAWDRDWQFQAENEARRRLLTLSCKDLGACTTNMLAMIEGPGGVHAAITVIIMIVLIIFRFRRRAGQAKSFWSSFLKAYAIVFLIAIAINIGDSPSGATRGAPLSGTLSFLARVTISLPWSYYFGIESHHFGAQGRPLADDSPLFWVFAFINLAFLGLMAIGEEEPVRKPK